MQKKENAAQQDIDHQGPDFDNLRSDTKAN